MSPRPDTHTVLVVDDEPLARRRLQRMLSDCEGVRFAGAAADVEQARAMVRQLRPDILLLDIQMPGGDGFELLSALGDEAPAVVFVTAFEHHAVRAFEVSAVDYLLKPVEPGRLALAMARVRVFLQQRSREEQAQALRETVATLRRALDGQQARTRADFWVRSASGHARLELREIVRFEAERDYVRIHAGERSFLHWESLASLEERLPAQEFVRIHRGSIVRRDRIAKVRRGALSSLVVVLTDQTELRVGRTYLPRIRAELAAGL